jgi:hypothetical protein
MIEWARKQLGCPYIFGAAGQTCTPEYRRQVMVNKPTYADAIKRNCPVLSGKQSTCKGCRYEGKPSYDCRGLTRLAVKAATGKPLQGAGATSQWNDASNWDIKGDIKAMPDRPCIVFVAKGSTMNHTGVYIGNNQVIHASGHNSGVIMSPMPRSWTHFAVPIGLYDEGETKLILKRGDKGNEVQRMQFLLSELGYSFPKYGTDGDFGAETEAAVLAFQQDHALPVTGTWSEHDQAMAEDIDEGIIDFPPEPIDEAALWAELEAHRTRDLEIYKLLKGA